MRTHHSHRELCTHKMCHRTAPPSCCLPWGGGLTFVEWTRQSLAQIEQERRLEGDGGMITNWSELDCNCSVHVRVDELYVQVYVSVLDLHSTDLHPQKQSPCSFCDWKPWHKDRLRKSWRMLRARQVIMPRQAFVQNPAFLDWPLTK